MRSRRHSSAESGNEGSSESEEEYSPVAKHNTLLPEVLERYSGYSFHLGRSTEAKQCGRCHLHSLIDVPVDAKQWPPLPSEGVVADFLRGCCLQLAGAQSCLMLTSHLRPKYLFVYELLSAVTQLQVRLSKRSAQALCG